MTVIRSQDLSVSQTESANNEDLVFQSAVKKVGSFLS